MIDFTKPVQTRDGRKVRVICKDAKGTQPVVALVPEADGSEFAATFSLEGRYYHTSDHSLDLINMPERVERWVNVYGPKAGIGLMNDSRSGADEDAGALRTAVLRITFEGGKPVAVALEAV